VKSLILTHLLAQTLFALLGRRPPRHAGVDGLDHAAPLLHDLGLDLLADGPGVYQQVEEAWGFVVEGNLAQCARARQGRKTQKSLTILPARSPCFARGCPAAQAQLSYSRISLTPPEPRTKNEGIP